MAPRRIAQRIGRSGLDSTGSVSEARRTVGTGDRDHQDGMIFVVEADERLRVGIEASKYEELVVNSVMEGAAFEHSLMRVVWFGTPIKEAEYRKMLDLIAWAREHQPDHPVLHPDEPIKLREVRVSQIF
jgi:hypothetical protein